MRLTFDAEELELQAGLRRFYGKAASEGVLRALIDTPSGHDPATWRRMATELDLLGLSLSSEVGGSDAGMRLLALVFEEQGRVLFGGPYLSTVGLAAPLISAATRWDRREGTLSAISTGQLTATLAHVDEREGAARWDKVEVTATATAEPADGGWSVTGMKRHVLDAAHSDVLLVTARTLNGPAVFAVDPKISGVTVTPAPVIDLSRRYAHVLLDAAPAELVVDPSSATSALRHAFDFGGVCLAAEQVGGAQRLLDLTVEYARTREQFGRVIGSFQAIKHMCADLLVAVEGARSAVYHASAVAEDESGTIGSETLTRAAALAQVAAAETYTEAARVAIQVHGGIGFTWEHPAHLYFRRAQVSRVYLGDPAAHRRVLAELLVGV